MKAHMWPVLQEFEIRPDRNSAGRRIYSEAQIERLQLVKHLVSAEKLAVAGARRQLAKMPIHRDVSTAPGNHRQTLLWLKKELLSVSALLDSNL